MTAGLKNGHTGLQMGFVLWCHCVLFWKSTFAGTVTQFLIYKILTWTILF